MSMVDGTMLGDAPPRKLDPRSLTSEERAIVDALVLRYLDACLPLTDAQLFQRAAHLSVEMIVARRKFFGEPASEPAKVECPNCGEDTYPNRHDFPDGRYVCQRPEAAKVFAQEVCPNCDEQTPYSHKSHHDDHYTCQPAQPEPVAAEMPPFSVIGHDGKTVAETTDGMAWATEFCIRMRNGMLGGPIDEGMMVGWFANAIESGRTAGRTHAAQPAKVGMSNALERVLDCAEMDANRDRMGGHESTAETTMAAIRVVRSQAAEAGKVRMPKGRWRDERRPRAGGERGGAGR